MTEITWIIIAVSVLAPIAITGYLVYYLLFAGKGQLIQNRAKASPATAVVVGLGQAGGKLSIMGQSFTKVGLRLKIHDTFKGEYQTDTAWWVDNLYIPQIQPGAQINVKIGADGDPAIYPEAPWAGVSVPDLRLKR